MTDRWLFKSDEDFDKYVELLNLARNIYPTAIYNYCLLDNHVHLLVEPKEDGSLSKFMQMVTKEYAKYYNKKYERRGHVFEGRFKSWIIQTEKYFFTCSRYIDLNPVKAGIETEPQNYKWTGYADLAQGASGLLSLDRHDLYTRLGQDGKERQIAYRTLIHNYQGEEIEFMDRRIGILGDRDFKKQVKGKRDS